MDRSRWGAPAFAGGASGRTRSSRALSLRVAFGLTANKHQSFLWGLTTLTACAYSALAMSSRVWGGGHCIGRVKGPPAGAGFHGTVGNVGEGFRSLQRVLR